MSNNHPIFFDFIELQFELTVDNLVNKRLIALSEQLFPGGEHAAHKLFESLFTGLDDSSKAFARAWWRHSATAPLNPVYILPSLKHLSELSTLGRVVAYGDLFIALARCFPAEHPLF
jgi:hypothetical protein